MLVNEQNINQSQLKGIKSVSKVFSVISFYNHRRPLKQEYYLSLVTIRKSKLGYNLVLFKTQMLSNEWDQEFKKQEV